MPVQRKAVTSRATLAISTRSVDTKRAIRIGNDSASLAGSGAAASPEWRHFTLGRLLLFVFSAYETRIIESLRAAGFPEVRQVHFAVMRHIDTVGGTRIGDLAQRAGVTKGAMGQLVAEFERLGLIKTSPDPADARAKRVELSKRGQKLITVTHQSSVRIEKEFAKHIGVQRFAALKSGLTALRESMTAR
jgi:DNA-binding MarR family transcriptional regulator